MRHANSWLVADFMCVVGWMIGLVGRSKLDDSLTELSGGGHMMPTLEITRKGTGPVFLLLN